ncbi:DUF4192 domain-containing protein [Arthrobacter sp. ZGTC212]|uniref:DUF4192 domain-containing protein n=1 Tax=Arthrobacter sp. ZGTC212 TaxID=2058899 RepID=UPI000CE51768|nr:DUF4192 domain-containing protein [Arthrobacter sp. ZGTC212]
MTNSRSRRPRDPFPVSGPADILAYIPHSLGFTPKESLVLMTVDSSRLGATLRLDLPASALDYSEFAAKVSGILRSDVCANGVLMALYTDRAWKRPDTPPYRRLIHQLSRCLTGNGLPIRDGWVISSTAWREYFCSDSGCCPWPGRPLQDITNSTLSAEMVYRGSAYAPTLEQAVALDLPEPWGEPGAVAAVHRAAYGRRLAGHWCGSSQFAGTLDVWETVIAGAEAAAGQAGLTGEGNPAGPETARGRYQGGSGEPVCGEPAPSGEPARGFALLRTDPETAGFLLASLRARPVRDTLLVMAALGKDQALAGAEACRLLSVDGARPLLPPCPDAAAQTDGRDTAGAGASRRGSGQAPGRGERVIAGSSYELPRKRPQDAGRDYRDVLVGQYPQSPRWGAMDAAFAVFAELLAADAADGEEDREASSALLSLMGWIEWARGRGSRAQVLLTRCLESNPGYRLAELLEELLATGVFPVWATNQGTAWKAAERSPGAARR